MAEFKECAACAAKSGSPVLCSSCIHNRNLIINLTASRDVLATALRGQALEFRAKADAALALVDWTTKE